MKIDVKIVASVMVAAAFGMLPFYASARLSGEAELGYISYDVEAGGVKRLDASSFQQRYSLLYSKTESLVNGRLGAYKMSFGYEWGSFDTKIKTPTETVNPSISKGHFLYDGDITIDPAEMPIRMRAYSRQMSRILFHPDTVAPISRGDQMILPNMPTNMSDGTNINSGITLFLAPKNGMGSNYSRIFDYFPLLYLDYRDEVYRDLKTQFPVNNRLRRLAFVSLNRRDNWFHIRSTQYDDYINPDSNFNEYQVQLGTVDHNLSRRWIDFSNWIKISADGQFTKRSGELETNRFEEYDLNMFAVATRLKWEGKTFTNFNRTLDNTGLTLERSIPIYLNGVWGDQTDWKFRFSSREKSQKLISLPDDDESDILMSLRVDTFKRRRFTLSQILSVEHKETKLFGNTLALEAGIETASTRRFSDRHSLAARYNLRRFGHQDAAGKESVYYNHDLSGRFSYDHTRDLRFDVDESIQIATGTNPQTIANDALLVNPGFNSNGSDSFVRRESVLNEYIRSVTTASVSWTPVARWRLGASVTEDILSRKEAGTDYLTTFRGSVDYTLASFSARFDNRFNIRHAGKTATYVFESYGLAGYRPNRNVDGSLQYRYNYGHDGFGSSQYIDLKQNLSYYLYKKSQFEGRLLELTEELTYSRSESEQSPLTRITRGIVLRTRYYPVKRVFLAGSLGYSLVDPGNYADLIYSASMGANFRSLQASLDYTHGKRSGGDNRIEDRFSANVRKLF